MKHAAFNPMRVYGFHYSSRELEAAFRSLEECTFNVRRLAGYLCGHTFEVDLNAARRLMRKLIRHELVHRDGQLYRKTELGREVL